MHVDTMRAVDRWAGIPLTFLLTQFLRLYHLLKPESPRRPARILFVELSEMGSTILADPAMRKTRDRLQAELFFVIFQKNRGSLDLIRTVLPRNIFTIRENNLFLLAWDTLLFLRWCRKQRIDTIIDLELFSRFTALLTGLSGAVNRVGFHSFHNEGLYRGALLSHRVAYNPHMHIAKNFIALVNCLLAPVPEIPFSKTRVADEEITLPRIRPTTDELTNMQELVRRHAPDYQPDHHRLVLINPNASELLPQRRWMPGRYVDLIRRILKVGDVLVLITGAPGEKAEAEAMRQDIGHSRCINFAGALRLEQLPSLYWISSLMVTNDSGPGHFSAITPLPTIVLFGPETPGLYGSLGNSVALYAGLACSPCVSAANHRKTPCSDNRCLQAITVEMVHAEVVRLLGEHPQAQKSTEGHRPDQRGAAAPGQHRSDTPGHQPRAHR